MVWGRMILHKRYTWLDYVMAATVTAGCFLFVMDRGVINDRQLRHERQATHGGVVDDTADGTYNAYAVPAPPGEESAGDYEEHSGAQVMEDRAGRGREARGRHHAEGGGAHVRARDDHHVRVPGVRRVHVHAPAEAVPALPCSILNQIFFTTCFSAVFSTAWLLSTAQMAQVWGLWGGTRA